MSTDTDSARWCETCKKWGDHHSDRHAEMAPVSTDIPDRQPSDAAVEAGVRAAFERKYGLGWDAKWIDEARRARAKAEIRADVTPALEAAYLVDRVDAPRLLLDRTALTAVLRRKLELQKDFPTFIAEAAEETADAVMEMARPMPTREQIAEALHDHWSDTHTWRRGCREDVCIAIFLDRADAVLDLLNGDGS